MTSKVRIFLLAVALIYVALAGIWWSGIGAVHASLQLSAAAIDRSTGKGEATFLLANGAPTPLRVSEIEVVDGRIFNTVVESVEVAGRSQSEVGISFDVVCGKSRAIPNSPVVILGVETAIGLERRVYAETIEELEC